MIISHLTTCHKFDDHRIFYKHAALQTLLGYTVKVFGYHKSQERTLENQGVTIQLFQSKKSLSKFSRVFRALRLLTHAIKGHQDIIIFHEPEFLLFCPFIRPFTNTIIIFDMHEDFPVLIRTRSRNKFIGLFAGSFMKFILSIFQMFIHGNFGFSREVISKYGKRNSLVVPNYPLYRTPQNTNKFKKFSPLKIAYIGLIGKKKGANLIVELSKYISKHNLEFELHLCGTPNFCPGFTKNDLYDLQQYDFVHFYGELNTSVMQDVLSKCHIGLCLLEDNDHHNLSKPAKIYEYVGQRNYVLFSKNLDLNNLISNGLGEKCDFSSESLINNLLRVQKRDFSNFYNIDISSYLLNSLEYDYKNFFEN